MTEKQRKHQLVRKKELKQQKTVDTVASSVAEQMFLLLIFEFIRNHYINKLWNKNCVKQLLQNVYVQKRNHCLYPF